jgi:hypothetical protein
MWAACPGFGRLVEDGFVDASTTVSSHPEEVLRATKSTIVSRSSRSTMNREQLTANSCRLRIFAKVVVLSATQPAHCAQRPGQLSALGQSTGKKIVMDEEVRTRLCPSSVYRQVLCGFAEKVNSSSRSASYCNETLSRRCVTWHRSEHVQSDM